MQIEKGGSILISMKFRSAPSFLLLAAVSLLPLLFFSACEISGGNETVREVSVRVAGNYVNSSGIPSNQTGNRITQLAINQSGDRLNAVDNQGGRWSGSIGRAEAGLVTFTLKGATSSGSEVVLTGTITVSGTDARLSGTWVEPGLTAAASAEATVAAAPRPTPTPAPNPNPTANPNPNPAPNPTATPVPTTGTLDPDDVPDLVITS